ncbi:hypothetical protein ESP131_00010 [Exiguobacterium sp. U13-1]|nr:hypothetical protein ESP131_00010 [Exiguobacterium sp. U13-1]
MSRVMIWIKTAFYFFASFKGSKKAKYLDFQKTVEFIIKDKISLIRFGDGEFNIIGKKDIHYQNHSLELENELKGIIENYNNNNINSNYLLCMPRYFFESSGYEIAKKRVFVSSWSFSRYLFNKKFDKNLIYGDSFVFSKGNEQIYEKIWSDQRISNVIFVHNKIEYGEKFALKYSKNVTNIEIPDSNAFEYKDEIINDIYKNLQGNKEILVIISAGPLGKVLVKELSEDDIWAIDTGHCWDDPLISVNKNCEVS